MTSVGEACRIRCPHPSAPEEFTMTTIRPCLWFDGQAEEAAALYVSLFPDSKILSVFRYPEESPMPAGDVATVDFLVAGLPVQLLNGGPHFRAVRGVLAVGDGRRRPGRGRPVMG